MNFLFVCTLSHLNGTLAAAGLAVSLHPPLSWMGEPVLGAWAETADGQIAMRWGRVPPAVAAAETLMEQVQRQMGPMV